MKTTRRDFLLLMCAARAAFSGAALLGGITPGNAVAAETGRKRAMVVFYSWSGNTRGIATRMRQKVGGDLVELELVTPYSTNYNTCLDEAKRDQERDARPELKTRIAVMTMIHRSTAYHLATMKPYQ